MFPTFINSQLAARDRSQFEFYKRQFELDREERRRERESKIGKIDVVKKEKEQEDRRQQMEMFAGLLQKQTEFMAEILVRFMRALPSKPNQ